MALRDHAAEVWRTITNDEACAMGWPVVLTDPAGFSPAEPLIGRSQDIAQVIDPDTGQMVSGRLATASLCIQDILDAGFSELPRNIPDTTIKPWLVAFDDLRGNTFTFKVVESNPDRTLDNIIVHLEAYE